MGQILQFGAIGNVDSVARPSSWCQMLGERVRT